MNKDKVIKALKQGPDYFKDNMYSSIIGTIDDYHHMAQETRNMKNELKAGHNPIDLTNELPNGSHPHMSDNIKPNEDELKRLAPAIHTLAQTPAGHDEIKSIKRQESVYPISQKLNQNPKYAKKLHLYSGKQVRAHMNKQIKRDKSDGFNDFADTTQVVENDVRPNDVYGDDVLHGDMDGEFGKSRKDIMQNIKTYAPHDRNAKKVLGLNIKPNRNKLIHGSFSNKIRNNKVAQKKQLRRSPKHKVNKAIKLNQQQGMQR